MVHSGRPYCPHGRQNGFFSGIRTHSSICSELSLLTRRRRQLHGLPYDGAKAAASSSMMYERAPAGLVGFAARKWLILDSSMSKDSTPLRDAAEGIRVVIDKPLSNVLS
jgi:hypothetical protein